MHIDTQRVALVSGASGAIGRAIAAGLAKAGFCVVLVGRDERKLEQASSELARAVAGACVRSEIADLSRREPIVALAARWHGPLHVLVNNAAIAPPQRAETPEGIELQFATNVLGYVWMIEAFREALALGAPARVVNVASYWAGDLDLDDLEFRRRRYDNNSAYRQSKQANRMLTVVQAEELRVSGTSVNACHPGDVNSALSRSLGFGGSESPVQGAATPVWLATSPDLGERSGGYFEQQRAVPCRFARDRSAIERLYREVQSRSG